MRKMPVTTPYVAAHLVWDSIWELLRAAPTCNESLKRSLTHGDASLLAECRKQASNLGITKALDKLRHALVDARATESFGEHGHTVDVSRFLTGEPECMLCRPEEDAPARIISISMNPSRSAALSNPEIRGALVIELCDLFESIGVRVELSYAYRATSHVPGCPVYWHDVPLKRAQDPLDLERVAVMFASANILTGLIWEHRGHGNAKPDSEPGSADIPLSSIPGSPEKMMAHVLEALIRLGINTGETP